MSLTIKPAVTVHVTGGEILAPGAPATVAGLSINRGDLVFVFETGAPYLGSDAGWRWNSNSTWLNNAEEVGSRFRTHYGLAPTAASELSFVLVNGRAYGLSITVVVVSGATLSDVIPGGIRNSTGSLYPGFDLPSEYVILAQARESLVNNFSVFRSLPGYTPLGDDVGWAGPFPGGPSGALSGGQVISGAYSWMAAFAIQNPAAGLPKLDSPVTVRFAESLSGVFADPTIEASFFQMVDLPVGGRYSLGDQLSGEDWYSFTIRDRSQSGGLITYSGETLIGRLSRITPRESLILVAGEDGVPDPLDLRECLRRFLTFYGVPFDPDLPAFFLRAGDEIVAPTVTGFVIQPDQENPESIYSMLERFFGPFRGYTWRADAQDRLVVTQPAWVDNIGLRLVLYTRLVAGGFPLRRAAASTPWSTTRRPTVEVNGTVDGASHQVKVPAPLAPGATVDVTLGALTVRLEWNSGTGVVSAYQWPTPGIFQTAPLYSITATLRPEVLPGDVETLSLGVEDLGPDEVESTSAESVINQAIVPVRERTFLPGQQIMQAAALVLASPGGVMPSLFGGNRPFGPMAEELETPSGFLELMNDTVQEGTWFWPADDSVVIQPGGNIIVAFEVEEWAEQWRDTTGPHEAAVNVNSWGDSVALPANGTEVKLFDFQFPRQTSNFAPSPYGARGTVWGRWVAGDTPGIQVRVGNSHFVEYGYLVEVAGIFGQTVYFLWGAIVKFNGTGATFTDGDLHTYRFGFSRGEDGTWEGGADVPALSESQRLYPDRVFHAPELPYQVTPATGLAIARAIVEENLTPKTVFRLPVEPSAPGGWVVRPYHLGRAARVQAPGINVTGRVVSIDYPEAHTPLGSSSGVTLEIEVSQPPPGSRAASRAFARAAYGVSHYQQED